MYVHEAQVPYTSPATRATSKPRGDDIICIYDFTLDFFASETQTGARDPVKNVIFRRACFVTRGLQFTIRMPQFTIHGSFTDFRLSRRTRGIINCRCGRCTRSVRARRETNERANSLNYGDIATFRNYSAVAVSARSFRENSFAIAILHWYF